MAKRDPAEDRSTPDGRGIDIVTHIGQHGIGRSEAVLSGPEPEQETLDELLDIAARASVELLVSETK